MYTGDDQEASPNREQVVENKSYAPQSTKRHVSRREAPFSCTHTPQQRAATNISFIFLFSTPSLLRRQYSSHPLPYDMPLFVFMLQKRTRKRKKKKIKINTRMFYIYIYMYTATVYRDDIAHRKYHRVN